MENDRHNLEFGFVITLHVMGITPPEDVKKRLEKAIFEGQADC